MITVSKAITIIQRELGSLRSETVELVDAAGRYLARDVVADMDVPPFDRSQMDGFAVRAEDTLQAPVRLAVVGESAAGHGWNGKLKTGEAVRIMTGARVPDGADAIQRLEVAREDEGDVTLQEPTETGRFIVRQAQEVSKGTVVMPQGERLTAENVATAAAFGYSRVKVAKKPRVAVCSTGSEIVEMGRKPGRDQIRNSNSVMLSYLCSRDGATAAILPNSGDDLEALVALFRQGLKDADVLITTGGVSVGKYDLTKAALERVGAEIFFDKVRLKPGKPTVFARWGRKLIFSLPGNPASAAVTYHLFVRPALLGLQLAGDTTPTELTAVASSEMRAPKERDAYLPAGLATDSTGRLIVTPVRWLGSSDLVGFAAASALAFVGRGTTVQKGDTVKVYLLDSNWSR